MKKRFDIYIRRSTDGLVKHHCPSLETEAKGHEVMLESETYLPQQIGSTYYGIRISRNGSRELWEIEFQPYQDLKPPFTYLGTFTTKLRAVADDWIEDGD